LYLRSLLLRAEVLINSTFPLMHARVIEEKVTGGGDGDGDGGLVACCWSRSANLFVG